jgi:diguanylate cyclase (GGDEF)-like protein
VLIPFFTEEKVHSAERQPVPHTWIRAAKTVVAYTLAYLAADIALNRFAFSDGWTLVWPLNGVNVALLLMRPRSSWPWMLLGIELGTGIGECLDENSYLMETGQRICSMAEVLISACLLPPFSTLDRWLRTPGIFNRFIAALILGPGISGLMAAMMFHFAKGQHFWWAFNNWATADALGMAATMPLTLALRSPQMRSLFQRHALTRTLSVLILAFAGAELIFAVSSYPLSFLLFPLLLLVDSMLAFAGSSIAVVGVLLISVYFTTDSMGPFGTWPADLRVPRDLAALDGLTGIANRRFFDERFAQEWSRSARHSKPLALAMIDLDNFKQFNDLYGHLAGDKCLRAVAEALTKEIQRPEDFVARFGGEEFALLLPHTSAEGAGVVLQRIREAIYALGIDHIGNSWAKVTVSIGYSSITPLHSEGQSRLIQLADAALYEAKNNGRNRVESITSIEGLEAAKYSGTATGRNRIVRILGRNDR